MAGATRSAPTRSRSTSTGCARSWNPWAARSARCAAWATSWSAIMQKTEPRLQRKLLAWLLGPLLVLLVLDAMAAYWVSQRFANLAYDRALHEIAREIVLHARPDTPRPRLELSDAAANILLMDAQDHLYYRVDAEDATALGGDTSLPKARLPERRTEPLFYQETVHGQPVRMIAARMPVDEAAGAPLVQVQVAETLNKRTRLALEMMANVVL